MAARRFCEQCEKTGFIDWDDKSAANQNRVDMSNRMSAAIDVVRLRWHLGSGAYEKEISKGRD